MPYERIRAVIDLDALIYNIQSMKQNLRPGTQVMAVVKADGYGHGAVPVAEAAEPYVDGFGTATAEEALQLRRQGIRKPVLVLGPVFESAWEAMLKEQIRFTLFEEDQAAALSAMARKLGAEALVHLAVDTGMNRIGMACTEEAADMAARISRMPGIRTEGLFTHLARADETDKEPTRRQLEAYRRFASWLEQRGVAVSVRHVSNSAGIIDQEGTGWDMVRAGISLYGDGAEEPYFLCKGDSGRRAGQLRRDLYGGPSHDGGHHSRRIRRWVSPVSVRKGLGADRREEGSDSGAGLHGPDDGGRFFRAAGAPRGGSDPAGPGWRRLHRRGGTGRRRRRLSL